MRSTHHERQMRIIHKQHVHEIEFIPEADTHELNFLG